MSSQALKATVQQSVRLASQVKNLGKDFCEIQDWDMQAAQYDINYNKTPI